MKKIDERFCKIIYREMPLYDGFEEDAYSDVSTVIDDDISETDSLSIRLKYSIRHAAIMLRWMFKTQADMI